MHHCINLSHQQRQQLLTWYRSHHDPQVRLRCHIILLLAEGYTWATIVAVLFTSSRTIARWQQRFADAGVQGLLGQQRGRPRQLGRRWQAVVLHWVLQTSPRLFGFFRTRWSCALVVCLLWHEYRLCVSAETVRRWLHAQKVVWRRAGPTMGREDPEREAIWQGLRQLLRDLPDDETVVFEDEVDINLNPEIGFMWMPKGEQTKIETPGDNEKRYLAGSLHWRTGTVFSTTGDKRNAKLFLRHVDELRWKLRRYKKIHIILDNARFHDCQEVALYYGKWHGRIQFHFLPKYAPDLNPIERIWWHLREEITRNHSCQSMEELIELTLGWLSNRTPFHIESSAYADLNPN